MLKHLVHNFSEIVPVERGIVTVMVDIEIVEVKNRCRQISNHQPHQRGRVPVATRASGNDQRAHRLRIRIISFSPALEFIRNPLNRDLIVGLSQRRDDERRANSSISGPGTHPWYPDDRFDLQPMIQQHS